jgi:hypothetical protein
VQRPREGRLPIVATFHSVLSPSESVVRGISAQYPCVPFVTPEYLRACAATGEIPCALLETDGDVLGTIGTLRAGRLSSHLQIPSAPQVPDPGRYWQALQSFCRRRRIWGLMVQTFASEPVVIPPLIGETLRYSRIEHRIVLQDRSLSLSANHQRNVNKAREAGLTVTATRSAADLQLHSSLVKGSLQRRTARLEDKPPLEATLVQRANSDLAAALPFESALLSFGAAEIFQARRGAEVLSSLFALRAPQAVYYRSGGTSGLGMTLGASTFLVAALAQRFQDEGLRAFILGGSDRPPTGLWRFKSGFGGEQRTLEAIEVSTEPAVVGALRWVRGVARRWRRPRGAGRAGENGGPSERQAAP